jgi:hypothetical protein
VTKTHKVTACQGVFKRSLNVMETYAINGILNMLVEKKYTKKKASKQRLEENCSTIIERCASAFSNVFLSRRYLYLNEQLNCSEI